MSRSQSRNIDAQAAALLSAWNDDTGAAFECEAEKILSGKRMNAALEAISGMTEESFSIFDAVRDCAGTVVEKTGNIADATQYRTDLFAFTIQGSADDVSNGLLGDLPNHIAGQMRQTGYADPNSTVFIFAAPLDPDRVSKLTPDMLRWLTIQAQKTLTSKLPDDIAAIRRALGAFQLTPPSEFRSRRIHEAIVIGARLTVARHGAPVTADLFCPDLLDLGSDEEKIRIRLLAEELSKGTERFLTEAGMDGLLVTQPLNFCHALNECAARRIAGWFATEAVTLGLPYEGDVDELFITQDGEYIMASAQFRQHLLGPVAIHRMLGGANLEELALSITNDIDRITFYSPSSGIQGHPRTVN